MLPSTTPEKWLEAAYALFVNDGPLELKVERMARILKMNKSGFYHYFGTLEIFLEELMQKHIAEGKLMESRIVTIKDFETDFTEIILDFKFSVLFHMRLVRNRHVALFEKTYMHINEFIDHAILPSWAIYIGLENDHALALRYFEIIRDMFYSRLSPEKFDEEHFLILIRDAKNVVAELKQKPLGDVLG